MNQVLTFLDTNIAQHTINGWLSPPFLSAGSANNRFFVSVESKSGGWTSFWNPQSHSKRWSIPFGYYMNQNHKVTPSVGVSHLGIIWIRITKCSESGLQSAQPDDLRGIPGFWDRLWCYFFSTPSTSTAGLVSYLCSKECKKKVIKKDYSMS